MLPLVMPLDDSLALSSDPEFSPSGFAGGSPLLELLPEFPCSVGPEVSPLGFAGGSPEELEDPPPDELESGLLSD